MIRFLKTWVWLLGFAGIIGVVLSPFIAGLWIVKAGHAVWGFGLVLLWFTVVVAAAINWTENC